jgi:hypothetical protein
MKKKFPLNINDHIYILFNIKNLSNQIVTSWTQDNWLRKPLYPQIP